MFIGRERELASLKEFYDKDGIGMTVIYGRRRIGKSTLITEFVKDKKTIFYTATKVGKNRNLELFSKQVVDLLMPGVKKKIRQRIIQFQDRRWKPYSWEETLQRAHSRLGEAQYVRKMEIDPLMLGCTTQELGKLLTNS